MREVRKLGCDIEKSCLILVGRSGISPMSRDGIEPPEAAKAMAGDQVKLFTDESET